MRKQASASAEFDKWLRLTIQVLRDRLNREPSEDEIMSFIFDDESHKQAIWNSEVAKCEP